MWVQWLILVAVIGLIGCRAATRVIEEPRVDLDLSGGNRGYLVGTPPAAPDVRTTRQMIETEIEVPTSYRPKRGEMAPVSLGDVAPPEMDFSETSEGNAAWSGASDTYTVKKGDTLWSIAANPDVFGNANKWRQIYEANRDALKSPDQLRPGMTLKIPRGADDESQAMANDATVYSK